MSDYAFATTGDKAWLVAVHRVANDFPYASREGLTAAGATSPATTDLSLLSVMTFMATCRRYPIDVVMLDLYEQAESCVSVMYTVVVAITGIERDYSELWTRRRNST